MSLTSQYFFYQGFFNGQFTGVNTTHSGDQLFSQSISNSMLTVHRPNNEFVFDLGKEVGSQENTDILKGALKKAGASLTSAIRLQGVAWPLAPYFSSNPAAHPLNAMLVRANFDFHAETPWFCSNVDGTISFYLFLYLNGAKRLQGRVDGAWCSFVGGGPFCTGTVKDALDKTLKDSAEIVQDRLDKALRQTAPLTFSQLYYLPGNGTKSPGAFVQNAGVDLSLGLALA